MDWVREDVNIFYERGCKKSPPDATNGKYLAFREPF